MNFPFFDARTKPEGVDGIETNPCQDDGECTSNVAFETPDPALPVFWSVYVHLIAGGVNCIADFATQEQAVAFGDLLSSAWNVPAAHYGLGDEASVSIPATPQWADALRSALAGLESSP